MIGPRALLVLGTDTGVGKTVVAALLTRAFQAAGKKAVPFKPVEAGGDDTGFLAAAAGATREEVGLYRFSEPLSPHLAAESEGRAIDTDVIRARFHELSDQADIVIFEGVGGALVPLTRDTLFLDFAAGLGTPAVIVARPGLGTLNHTLLTVEACLKRGVDIAGIIVNRFPDDPTDAERNNPEQLHELTGLPILGIIPELDISVEAGRAAGLGDFTGLDIGELTHPTGRGETRLPHPVDDGARAIAADAEYVWHPFTPMREYLSEKPHPLMIVGGEGCRLIGSDGRRYIDGVSSLWVNIHGHRHPVLDGALRAQLDKIAHTTLLGLANEPSALLAEVLAEIMPGSLKKVFYSDSGSTAVEIALKVAFQYQKLTGRPEKKDFVTFTNAYHGDTIGAVSVGGHDLFHSIFKPLLFKTHLVPAAYCYRCPKGTAWPECGLRCLDDLKRTLETRGETIAAVIFEPKVQGAAGILVQPPGYMRRVADLCREHSVLLIADEVATGFGRTGPLFACELEGVEPDIMTVAKGITGGYLPLAATVFRPEIYDAFLGDYEEMKTFFHGHSYTGNPLACAVALASIGLLRDTALPERARERAGELGSMLATLRKHPNVGDIRQCGLMAGIELVADKRERGPFAIKDRVGRAVTLKARENGVVIRPLGDVLVLMPPLVISGEELSELVAATAAAIDEVTCS